MFMVDTHSKVDPAVEISELTPFGYAKNWGKPTYY